jgi:hypothetical protein
VAGCCEHGDERSGSGATELVVSFKYSDVSEVRTAVTIEAVCTSETSVYFNDATRRSIPEGCQTLISQKV